MKIKCWLRITADGSVSALKMPPVQENGQVNVALSLDIPDEAFQPPKMPTVEITLDAAALPKLTVVQEAMDSLNGAGIKVKIVEALKLNSLANGARSRSACAGRRSVTKCGMMLALPATLWHGRPAVSMMCIAADIVGFTMWAMRCSPGGGDDERTCFNALESRNVHNLPRQARFGNVREVPGDARLDGACRRGGKAAV